MKLTTLTAFFSLAVACVGLGLAPVTRAANFTNFLESLQAEVDARLATNEDASEKRALTSAHKALNPTKDAKSLSQDLSAFGRAVSTLNKAFGEDEALANAEETSFNWFLGEAEAQYNAVNNDSALHTNGVPVSLSNALAKAYSALTNAQGNTNWAARVRALNLAFVKIKVAQLQLNKSLKAPADDSLEGKTIHVALNTEERLHFTLDPAGTYDTGAETGSWSYTRTSANTGTITLNIDGGGTHVYHVTFKNPKTGTFTVEGEEGVTGKISIK